MFVDVPLDFRFHYFLSESILLFEILISRFNAACCALFVATSDVSTAPFVEPIKPDLHNSVSCLKILARADARFLTSNSSSCSTETNFPMFFVLSGRGNVRNGWDQ